MFDTIMLFIFGLLLLIKGGDWFVDSATGIAHRFRIPEIIIGATIVSIGTTLPEVMVSATSAVGGHGEIAYGNAIGSIICNTALIAAITIAIRPPKVDRKTFTLPVIFFFVAAVVYMIVAYVFGEFLVVTGIILLVIFVAYMAVTIWQAIKSGKKPAKELVSADMQEPQEGKEEENKGKGGKFALVKDITFLIIGAAFIALGAKLLVDNGTKIAEWMGVPESVIALTFVALGTSLPELVTAITALIKGHGSLSLGNIIGANLFNLVLVAGISIVLAPFAVPAGNMIEGISASLIIDLPVMLFVMMLLTLPAIIRGKLSRWQGITLLTIYAAFCTVQFVL